MDCAQYTHYQETERFLDSLRFSKTLPHFVPQKRKGTVVTPFGLEGVASFLSAAGKPQRKNRYIHITGTSGKSSCSYFMTNLLQSQGYRSGLFTSPELCTFAEYFMLDQRLPDIAEIMQLLDRLKPLVDQEYELRKQGHISHFELLLSAAVIYFAEKKSDYVVLEAGLGGKHDATNVIEQAEISIISNVGLDHTHILGKTLPEIAVEKAGIIKRGSPLLTAESRPEILKLFREHARMKETEVQVLGEDFSLSSVNAEKDRCSFSYHSALNHFPDLSTRMRGAYQARNAALAIRAMELLSAKRGQRLDEGVLREALHNTVIPARYEPVQDDPPVILDGAHNPDKMRYLLDYLKTWYRRDEIVFVCGFTSGRSPKKMLRSLLALSRQFYLTRPIIGYRDDEDPLHLKKTLLDLDAKVMAELHLDPFVALDAAIQHASQHGKTVCVTGSLYLVSHLRQRWFPTHKVLQTRKLW